MEAFDYPCFSSELDPDGLGLEIALDTGLPVLVAPAGLFESAKGHGGIPHHLAVDGDCAGVESFGETVGVRDVFVHAEAARP